MRFKEFTDIDSLRHAKVDEKPVKNFKGDYKNLTISEPPTNSSKVTQAELTTLRELMSNRTSGIEDSVKAHDNDVVYAIKKYMKDKDLDYSDDTIEKIVEIGSGVARYYKNKFQRPRPYNLAEAMKMDFDNMPLDSDTMKTPAYPSGHSLQSKLVADYYAEKYPSHKDGLLTAAEECGKGRLYAGWHYPSDHEAAIKLAKQIQPNVQLKESMKDVLMKFLKKQPTVLKDSIIDIPRQRYAPGVFDDADTDNPKLKKVVVDMILDQIDNFQEKYPVKKYSLIGSILTKKYRDDADLDINVLFDVPEEDRETARKELASSLRDINGKLVPGTKHPVNYYVITDPELKKKNDAMADGVFDIDENEFIRKPTEDTFDPEKYEADFQKKVQEIDVVKGELARDIIDYEELKDLSTDDVLNLQDKINTKLDEIEDSIEVLVDIGDDVVKQRQSAYNDDMTPDEIRQFGKKHKLPKNIIYKYLEKYHYLKFYKKCKEVLEDGKVTDDEIKKLKEQSKPKTIAFTFGRFNPPTIGHQKLMDKVKTQATNYKIYLSRSEDAKKNPLDVRYKLRVMKQMFRTHARNIEINPSNNVLDILVKLYDDYHRVIMVVGSDRVREFTTLLNKYNNVKSRHGYYYFEDIKVVSAGERDPDAEGAEGMSASKMRAAAAKGDLTAFKKGLPGSFRGTNDAETLMKNVRVGMNLAASYSMMGGPGLGTYKPVASLEGFEQNQVRDLYVREMIFNINDKVDYVKEDISGIVKRRGTNYIVIEDNNNNLHKAWIWDCLPVAADREVEVREYDTNVDYGFTAVDSIQEDLDATPQDKDVKKKKGTQPKKYYSGLSKDVKDKRADHFKKDKYKKGDTDYKPAPGDKDAKTKPSIHTKKFKQMYGEVVDKLDEKGKGLWHNIHMKRKRGERMRKKGEKGAPTTAQLKRAQGEQKEAYDIGHDYADYAAKITPGQPQFDPKFEGGNYEPSKSENNLKKVITSFKDYKDNKVKEKDVKEWAMSDATIYKYKERYKEIWREKLDEVVKRMMEKI